MPSGPKGREAPGRGDWQRRPCHADCAFVVRDNYPVAELQYAGNNKRLACKSLTCSSLGDAPSISSWIKFEVDSQLAIWQSECHPVRLSPAAFRFATIPTASILLSLAGLMKGKNIFVCLT